MGRGFGFATMNSEKFVDFVHNEMSKIISTCMMSDANVPRSTRQFGKPLPYAISNVMHLDWRTIILSATYDDHTRTRGSHPMASLGQQRLAARAGDGFFVVRHS